MTTQYKGTETTKMQGLFATKSENNEKLTLAFMTSDEQQEVGMLTIYLKKYVEDSTGYSGSYVDDEETMKEAEEALIELGTTLEDVEMDIATIEHDLYFNGEIASLHPIKTFVKFDKISVKDGKLFSKTPQEVTLNIINEFRGIRFDLGFEWEDEGATSLYRISSLTLVSGDPNEPDRNISLRYQSRKLDALHAQIHAHNQNEKVLPEEVFKVVKKNWESTAKRDRADKSAEIKELFGIDLLEWLENPDMYEIKALVSGDSIAAKNPKDVTYFLNAEILDVVKKDEE